MIFDTMTTDELIECVRLDSGASDRELALLDRLCGAMEEIDVLTRDVARLQTAKEPSSVDA